MQQFSVGDVVILKSGGPHMTITRLGESGAPVCDWFRDTGEHGRDQFPADCLILAREKLHEAPQNALDEA